MAIWGIRGGGGYSPLPPPPASYAYVILRMRSYDSMAELFDFLSLHRKPSHGDKLFSICEKSINLSTCIFSDRASLAA